ncbi:hypothetical protein [Lysobacter sp. K5869]|uniref:hypothetical protein n=1 Tax=Lysobacter sp. K5869 TaxID=2820808 RepID=UPI002101D094|nr:hypothetical protein [Lysobacter sp. K5869]
MKKLTPPAVPPTLCEMLKDYPEHIERLREALRTFVAVPKLRLQPYDDALWTLVTVVTGFIDEASKELREAEGSGDPARIARARAKRELMFLARSYSGNGGLGGKSLDDLWDYFQKHKEAFE